MEKCSFRKGVKMSWEQILGFFTMWPSPWATIALWAKANVPIWQTILYVTFITSISLSLTYFGTGWIEKWIIKRGWVKRATIEKWRNYSQSLNNSHPVNGLEKRVKGKIKKWLLPQKDWQILACGFIPFVPLLPTIIIVATRLLEIKRGFPLLIAGNIFRNAVVCWAIYKGVGFFS